MATQDAPSHLPKHASSRTDATQNGELATNKRFMHGKHQHKRNEHKQKQGGNGDLDTRVSGDQDTRRRKGLFRPAARQEHQNILVAPQHHTKSETVGSSRHASSACKAFQIKWLWRTHATLQKTDGDGHIEIGLEF